ncbi:MAG: hypothetical protein RIT31_731, partial [Actinomycetota bacterium]
MKLRITILLASIISLNLTTAQAAPIYTFPVAGCTVKYGKYHHTYPAT